MYPQPAVRISNFPLTAQERGQEGVVRERDRSRGHPKGFLSSPQQPQAWNASPPSSFPAQPRPCGEVQHQLCHLVILRLQNKGLKSQATGKRAEMKSRDSCEGPSQPLAAGRGEVWGSLTCVGASGFSSGVCHPDQASRGCCRASSVTLPQPHRALCCCSVLQAPAEWRHY